ncbi:hypothetical protein [uncultured Cyclobacterium sp.]|uniref:DUF7255 family protein n=1 Tax=uncultured Cyclobacterium sp. TaxID=453820 RepID=UPI0030EB8F2C|tara:strand:- start:109122 stop:109766 length:645 start_codon:yes stop_codon:yes gene_type:complete
MHHLKIDQLIKALEEIEMASEVDFILPVKRSQIKGKGEALLSDAYSDLNGNDEFPFLNQLKVDIKIDKFLFVYDDPYHFNRYRLKTLKADIYSTFSFSWHQSYLRMCRTFERECLVSGSQERIWNGPPIASRCFGPSEEAPDLSGNGSSGWKLNAYNDLQYDLISRLQGYKLIRIPAYENLMIGGKLQRIDKLLLRPNAATLKVIGSWMVRKMN